MRDRAARRAAIFVPPLALLLILAAAVLDANLHHWEILRRMAQPDAVEYPDGRKHYLGVERERSWILRRHRAYYLYAGSDPGFGYGHFVRLDFGGLDRPELAKAGWRDHGVRARFTSGHEVFVPSKFFQFGR